MINDQNAIVGDSEQFRYVMFRVEQVAATSATVLLVGEPGTGKKLIARTIHERSSRRTSPIVVADCSSRPAMVIESEFFGRDGGASTPRPTQIGWFELANRGTIFLDEIGELPLEVQPKFLRVLQEKQSERLGSSRTVDVDVRVVATTSRDLEDAVRRGRFRRDLYDRLSVFPIRLPPLRDRGTDIRLLVRHLVDRLCGSVGKRIETIPPRAMERLEKYSWPGNIRELEDVLRRAVTGSAGSILELQPGWIPTSEPSSGNERDRALEIERGHVDSAVASPRAPIDGVGGAPEIPGIKPSAVRSRLEKR